MTAPSWLAEAWRLLTRPYQRRWLHAVAGSPLLGLLGGRQIGKDRTLGVYLSSEALFQPGTEWHCLSATQRHANDLMREVKKMIAAFRAVAAGQGLRLPDAEVDNVGELRLSNGSRIVSHAATPRSAQGSRGSVLLNEVGIMPRAEEIYETTYSIVTGQLDQGRPARMVMMGNASHRGSFWHSWWMGPRSTGATKIVTTWEDAFRSWHASRGWAADRINAWIASRRSERIQQIGAGAFAQWYQCLWRSAEEMFFSPALLERASVDVGALEDLDLSDRHLRQWVGYDVARRVHAAALAQVVQHRTGWQALPVMVMRDKAFRAQRAEAGRLVRQRSTAGLVLDSTGMGEGQYEELGAELACKVHGVNFSATDKLDLFATLKDQLESGNVRLPLDDVDLRMELEGVEARYTGGRVRVELPEDERGHCDRAVALALASYGAAGRLTAQGKSRAWRDTYGIG